MSWRHYSKVSNWWRCWLQKRAWKCARKLIFVGMKFDLVPRPPCDRPSRRLFDVEAQKRWMLVIEHWHWWRQSHRDEEAEILEVQR